MVLLPRNTVIISVFIVLFSLFLFVQRQVVFADTAQQYEQQKSAKQQELNKIMADISAISNSNAGILSKISELKTEKSKLEKLLASMSADLKVLEDETKNQESELISIAGRYSLQQALYTVDSQKNILITLFESPDLSNMLERLLYYSVQSQSMRKQRDLIAIKQEGIAVKRKQIDQEQGTIQKSLSSVNQEIAKLENQQSQYAVSLSRSYAQRNSLVSDISKLTRAAQAAIAKKVSSSTPTTGGGVGSSGGSGVVNGTTNNNTTGAMSIIVDGTLLKKTSSIIKMSAANDEIKINGKFETEYAGTLEFNKNFGTLSNGTRIYVVNSLSLDKYLWGLAEMPSSWAQDALKVQAIAGRTYATYKMRYAGYGNFDLLDYVQDQEYSGLSKIKSSYGSNWKSAVDSTSDMVMEYGGKTILAYYSADNGGHSVSGSESGFGNFGYLSAKSDRYDGGGGLWKTYGSTSCSYWIIQGNRPNFPWCGQTRQSEGINTMARMQDYLNGAIYYQLYGKMVTTSELSPASLQALLSANGKQSIQEKVGTITDIDHVYDQGGSAIVAGTKYTKSVVVTGTKGTATLSGTAFKTSYNVRAPYNNAVYSTLYDIKKVDDNNWELWTRGFGHRVGMSQYGANGRAQAGQNYEQILEYYYNNANVVQYDVGRNVRVALTKVGSRVMKVTAKSEISIYEGGTLIKTVPANTEIRVEYN